MKRAAQRVVTRALPLALAGALLAGLAAPLPGCRSGKAGAQNVAPQGDDMLAKIKAENVKAGKTGVKTAGQ